MLSGISFLRITEVVPMIYEYFDYLVSYMLRNATYVLKELRSTKKKVK